MTTHITAKSTGGDLAAAAESITAAMAEEERADRRLAGWKRRNEGVLAA